MKKVIQNSLFLLLILITILFSSCSQSGVKDSVVMNESKVRSLEEKVKKDPNDPEAMKNLGISYVQVKKYREAADYLDRAIKVMPNDPELLFYKGLDLEFFLKQDEAINIYKRYSDIPEQSPYRQLMAGRYNWLMRVKAYYDVRELVKDESKISSSGLSDSTMAVFPLIYEGVTKDYLPLSRGFSEMISIDLSKVKQLKILERVRIQAVLDELKLSQTNLVDQSTAPRAGKLLRAGVIVSGSYDVDKGAIKVGLGSWNVMSKQRKSWMNASGDIKDFFALQKELVFIFLQKNNIEITQQEKEAIAFVPTRSLEAFLAYCKGLIQEDADNFTGAAQEYKRAYEIDPNFKIADEKLKTAESTNLSSVSKEQMIDVAIAKGSTVNDDLEQLVNNRSQSMGNNISSSFSQSVDSRSPAQEGIANVTATLPMPPNPPSVK